MATFGIIFYLFYYFRAIHFLFVHHHAMLGVAWYYKATSTCSLSLSSKLDNTDADIFLE